ncbi:MAG: hypothetical protein RIR18_960 [Pseudomonadota bacterium]|jgi:hypothetical protein
MVSSISRSALASDLSASYQRVNQAQGKVEESRRLVDTNRAELEKSNIRLDKDKGQYANELQRSKSVEQTDLRNAVQKSTSTEQLSKTQDKNAQTFTYTTLDKSKDQVQAAGSVSALQSSSSSQPAGASQASASQTFVFGATVNTSGQTVGTTINTTA